MKPLLLFIHGWGFDSSIWDELRKHFAPADTIAWDLGFFGAPSQPALSADRPILAIGHSFGLLWLLHQRNLPIHACIAINGFTCFAQRKNFPEGIAPRLLTRMRSRLATDPHSVIFNFRTLCGVTDPFPATPAIETLAEGLEALQNWDERPATITAALCGASDPLVSPAMSRVCFPETRIHWHEAGHMLPLEAPAWCANHLRNLSEALA